MAATQPLTNEERGKCLAVLQRDKSSTYRRRNLGWFMLAIYYGGRVSENCALQWRHLLHEDGSWREGIELEAKFLKGGKPPQPRSKPKGHPEGCKCSRCLAASDDHVEGCQCRSCQPRKRRVQTRCIPIHAELKKALTPWLAEARRVLGEAFTLHAPVFVSRVHGQGGALRGISRVQAWRICRRLYLLAGIRRKVATHGLRKVFAEACKQVYRGDLLLVQKAMGHISLDSTSKYFADRTEEMQRGILQLYAVA